MCLTYVLLFFVFFSNALRFIPITDSKERYSLKLSDNEIILITPENVTYTKPMDGYYSASFSFEEDNVGSEGLEINFVDQNNTFGDASTTVVSELDGHNNLLDLWDGNQLNAYAEVWNNFSSNQSNGTIEFWTQVTTVANTQRMHWEVWGDAGDAIHLALNRDAGGTLYYDDGSYHAICALTANDWYHFKITFNASSDWHLEVRDKDLHYIGGDGNLGYGYKNSVSYMDRLRVTTASGNAAFGFHMYMDAIGYSWDPNYSVKDNLYEGLLLSFENSTQLDWIGYSLDGQANKTILGNTTFSMPNSGLHSVQVFGSDSFFTMYQSQKIYFTIDSEAIKIITPENITYTAPMDGYYPATYDFDDNLDGTRNLDANFIDSDSSGSGSYFETSSNFLNHNKVLKAVDGAGASGFNGIHYFNQTASTGTIEFWYAIDNDAIDNGMNIRFYTDGGHAWYLNGYKGYFRSNGWVGMGLALANTWYHIKMVFNCSLNKVDIYIDAEFKGTVDFAVPSNQIEYVVIESDPRYDTSFTGYLDAFGYSWDENYDVGDNLQEGLLLGYETIKHLDWIGYSLDNKANITIMGNKTLSLPINGSYNVQVFANDTFGAMYQSEKRYFHYYFDATIPDIPTSVLIRDGWEHIYMSWDVPDDNGAPITRYNIYRGEIENSSKMLLDTSIINEYNDTTAVVGTIYYYYISAVNILGESENSTEVSGIAWDAPFVRWRSPEEGAFVILPDSDTIFNFVYDWGGVTEVELIIINATNDEYDFGSVFNETSCNLAPYSNSTDGPIRAELRGYNGTDLVVTHSRNFTLSKLTIDVYDRLDSNTTIIGNVLYMILHDPNGDNSYSSFSETTTLSMGMSSQITNSIAASVKVGAEFDLFGYKAGASVKVTAKATDEIGYDYRYEVVDKTELTSSLDSTNKDYIGPGFGDRYWGEAWIYKWELMASYREYVNGTKRYEDPKLNYGVIRDAEVILNDYNAPDEWRALNPVHNGWQNVDWRPPINHDGGAPYYESQEVTTTEKRTHTFKISLDTSAWTKVGIVETTLNISLNVKNYVEHSEINTYTTACEIYDDESTDTINMNSGIDLTFGTYIFNTTSFFCETSYPLEHNTKDYIAPIIEFPNIDLDSNDDGIAPGSNDSPIITVDIFEEGSVSTAYIRYSINNGGTWLTVILSEQLANPGTWEKNLPAQARGTIVLWYLQVWDTAGLNSTRKNPMDEPYSYTILNSVPTVSVNTPNGGEDYTNTVRIEWSDYDEDDDDLLITLAYNLGGVGWHLIATNITGSFYNWDISSLGYSDSALIKVIVNDGVGGETEDTSDFVFTIGEPPIEEVPPDTMMFIIVASAIGGIGVVSVITIMVIRKRK